jgi:hypothetical protein
MEWQRETAVDENEPFDPLPVITAEDRRDPPAHRIPGDDCFVDAEMIEASCDVVRDSGQVEGRRSVAAPAPTSHVEGDEPDVGWQLVDDA